ncbi:tyrosine-type recombinase/integrase [Vibrio quintilis]|uniref:Site-specific tyrosine recombinase XerC n=1 Tax=Vibrio quintilis TaxID=1117707 RepID=A0A1M7YZ74_9VIBR|nr:tyrosine-type recombinase/integrase [Vibrio quintilis]SHO57873.1 site-specific tyrosine recombinase XerC [Vibrio quintilis]
MALPPFIDKAKRDWLFKVTELNSTQPERDAALLAFFFGSACTTLEINRIQLKDVLKKSGKLSKRFDVRGNERVVYLTNPKLCDYTNRYIDYRVKNRIGLGDNPDQYLGLDPDDALFFSYQSKPFSIVRTKTKRGNDTYRCDALNRHLKMLMQNAGIESPSILSGRRTFAVTLHRQGYDIAHIHYMLGNKTLETTQKLLTTDPISMGDIARNAF